MSEHEDMTQSVLQKPVLSQSWMLILADLLSLILIFFILLYMISQPAQDQWKELTHSLALRLNPSRSEIVNPLVTSYEVTGRVSKKALSVDYIGQLLENALRWEPTLHDMELVHTPNYVMIRLPILGQFEMGKITLPPTSEKVMFHLADTLMQFGNRIHIVGSSDPFPLKDHPLFKSNWELSIARAFQVAQSLRRAGYLYPMTVLASDHYDQGPITKKKEKDIMLHQSLRRVDIIVYHEKALAF